MGIDKAGRQDTAATVHYGVLCISDCVRDTNTWTLDRNDSIALHDDIAGNWRSSASVHDLSARQNRRPRTRHSRPLFPLPAVTLSCWAKSIRPPLRNTMCSRSVLLTA